MQSVLIWNACASTAALGREDLPCEFWHVLLFYDKTNRGTPGSISINQLNLVSRISITNIVVWFRQVFEWSPEMLKKEGFHYMLHTIYITEDNPGTSWFLCCFAKLIG